MSEGAFGLLTHRRHFFLLLSPPHSRNTAYLARPLPQYDALACGVEEVKFGSWVRGGALRVGCASLTQPPLRGGCMRTRQLGFLHISPALKLPPTDTFGLKHLYLVFSPCWDCTSRQRPFCRDGVLFQSYL